MFAASVTHVIKRAKFVISKAKIGVWVMVEGRGSKVKNTKFLSILKVLQPLNAAKQLVWLSKLKNFAYGYAVWLCTV
jgi:hypothetical protein